MIDSPSYSRTASSDDTHTLFGQTMGYVAATAGLFALGAYLGRDLPYGFSFAGYIAALVCLFCMNFTRQSGGASAGLLFAVGLLLGLSSSPMIVYYASTDPAVLWQAGGATALFIAGCGAIGYATRQDLSALGRLSFWALAALIIFGVVMIFASIPGGERARQVPHSRLREENSCRKKLNTFSASRKIDAAISGAESTSEVSRSRWKSNMVRPAKITSPRLQ